MATAVPDRTADVIARFDEAMARAKRAIGEAKTAALVGRVAAIWRETEEVRGTQLVFCDLGVNPTPWGYSVYDELVAKKGTQ